jgi:hypothetical protein
VAVYFGAEGIFDEEFIEDRKQMLPGAAVGAARRAGPAKLMQLRSNRENLEEQLRDGRAYLLGG